MDTWTLTERPVSEIDAWLSSDDVFATPPAEARTHLAHHLREALRHHVDVNPNFAAYAKQLGFVPDDVDETTLDRIPLLPSGLFKRAPAEVRTGTAEIVDTTSSGTQGSVSRVPRDDVTMMRFFASVAAAVRDLMDIEHSETFIHNVGPTVEESHHLWISYVMSGVSVIHDTDFYVTGGVVEVERLVEALRVPTSAPSVVVGPPPLLADLAAILADDPLPVSDQRRLVTIGGWKRRAGEMVDRDTFDAMVVEAFGLSGRSAVRDAFNMVELNTIILECEHRRKHCPPWLYISARDAKTLEPLGSGEVGILSYADPTATSFPGMVLSEDFGSVTREVACECGVTGDVLAIERRINRLESRGCAMKI